MCVWVCEDFVVDLAVLGLRVAVEGFVQLILHLIGAILLVPALRLLGKGAGVIQGIAIRVGARVVIGKITVKFAVLRVVHTHVIAVAWIFDHAVVYIIAVVVLAAALIFILRATLVKGVSVCKDGLRDVIVHLIQNARI